MNTPPPNGNNNHEDPVRPHTYDGIQEYDKRLPNWWLLTFYGAIVFAVVYWFYYKHSGVPISDGAQVEAEIAQIEAAKLASGATSLDDATLWQMSKNPVVVEAGKATYAANCVACHLASLRGKDENPTAIGVNLADDQWLYGSNPTQVLATVTKGTANGMPTWGPLLGPKKVSEVVAYVLSFHEKPAATDQPYAASGRSGMTSPEVAKIAGTK